MTTSQDLAQNDDLASLELLLAHSNRPITRPAGIPRLNELIQQLAPQDPADEAAAVLLERIRAAKSEGKKGRQLELPGGDVIMGICG